MKTGPGTAALGLAASLYATLTSAQASFNSGSNDDIKFSWAVPESVASSGSGNVYFQIDAPDSYSWVGLGIGSRMSGAEMFLIYQDGSGGLTLSTRQGQGHVEPEYTERSGVELIDGSTVADGRMTANIRCGSCDSLELDGENSWIAAWMSGDSLDSTNVEEPINVHNGRTSFTVDFSAATVQSDDNPFDGSNSDPNDDGGNNGGSDGDSNGGSEGDSNDNNGVVDNGAGGPGDDTRNILLAHGVVMTIVFVGLYPLGAIMMPLMSKWFIHAAVQTVAFLLMWAGFALGYVFANRVGYLWVTHTLVGIVVVALLGIQPVLGALHHMHFRKHGGRGLISHIHIWYGRALMVLGIVNGGLGLRLTRNTDGAWVIAYSVVAGVLFIVYLISIVIGWRRKRSSRVRAKA